MAAEGRRYQVERVLGKGGFGTVYQAEMLSAGGFAKPVALKVLNREMEGMAEVAQRLRDEARLLGRLKHPAILRVDDLVKLDGHWTVVMELLAGANLHQLVRTTGPLPLGVGLEIAQAVAGALDAAHDRPGPGGEPLRVLHRDIKPSNIQVTPLGEIKVLDFGVARASFATREAQTRSLIFGSLGYMAPERMAGRDSHAGDIYALGVVIIEILSGRRLGNACSHASLQTTMVEDALVDLSAHCDDPELHSLLRAALAFEPDQRPRARDFQRRSRRLRSRPSEPWRTAWAAQSLPGVMGEQKTETGPLTGRVLCEGGSQEDQASRADPARGPGPPPAAGTTGGFTPMPVEQPTGHPSTPTRPHSREVDPDDGIPSEPLGLPPLPAARGRSDTPPPIPAPAPGPGDPGTPSGVTTEQAPPPAETQWERLPLSEPAPPPPVTPPLQDSHTGAQPAPAPASAPRSRWLGRAALLAVLTLGAAGLGLAILPALLGPSEPAAPAVTPIQPDGAQPDGAVEAPAEQAIEQPAEAPSPPPPEPARRSEPARTSARTGPKPEERSPPVATPAPVRSQPAPATVSVTGDATTVVLRNEGGSHGPGPLPPGHYEIYATFPGLDAPAAAGSVDLESGQSVRLYCESGFDRCEPLVD